MGLAGDGDVQMEVGGSCEWNGDGSSGADRQVDGEDMDGREKSM